MKWICAAVALSLTAMPSGAQQGVPEIKFDANIEPLKLPASMHFGEVVGIAMNSKRHVFVFTRTGERSTVHGASAAQLFEFDQTGAYVREIGKDLYGFAFAHTVRIENPAFPPRVIKLNSGRNKWGTIAHRFR